MKFSTFLNKTSNFPLFGEELLATLGGTKASRGLQLHRWTQSGKLIRLKRGLYTLPDDKRKAPLSLRWLANTLYSPSYLSLEYMLAWYDMIPERVTMVTSVTPLKTAKINNSLGRFVYRHLKKDLFFGFFETKDEFQYPILMATPEKAILDFIYLYPHWQSTPDFMEKNIRLQQLDQLQKKRLKGFAKKYNSKKITKAADVILGMI